VIVVGGRKWIYVMFSLKNFYDVFYFPSLERRMGSRITT
jgi:hypothetical protein